MSRWAIAGFLILLSAGVVAWFFFARALNSGHSGSPNSPAATKVLPDPRLTYSGPFQNIHPDVHYVGSKKCAECHSEIVRSFARHPMGHSLHVLEGKTPEVSNTSEVYGKGHHNPFEALGFMFAVNREGNAVRHRVSPTNHLKDPDYQLNLPVAYAVGSGSRGISYLSEHDGYVFQTPITWYVEKRIWDLSPGYTKDLVPGRPVVAGCLFCHVENVRAREGTLNGYETPLALENIGCERCHGPGEKHLGAAGPLLPNEIDYTIVNPRHLSPHLRDAVCQQCHLHGDIRLQRRGRGVFDFRPGLPLESCWSIFVSPHDSGDERKVVNQAEQMAMSLCFLQSPAEHKLGCISCHDPHRRVGEVQTAGGEWKVSREKRDAFYRDRCLDCHKKADTSGSHEPRPSGSGATHPPFAVQCALARPARLLKSKDDNCVTCHMPRYTTSDIGHASATDHRIIRRPDDTADTLSPPGSALPLRDFYADSAARTAEDQRELQRDLGIALVQRVRERRGKLGPLQEGLKLIDDWLRDNPGDLEACEQKSEALLLLSRAEEALSAAETVLAWHPQTEGALTAAATAAQTLGRAELAERYWGQANKVNPWTASYRESFARFLASQKSWDKAAAQCREWLKLDPASTAARKILADCNSHASVKQH